MICWYLMTLPFFHHLTVPCAFVHQLYIHMIVSAYTNAATNTDTNYDINSDTNVIYLNLLTFLNMH